MKPSLFSAKSSLLIVMLALCSRLGLASHSIPPTVCWGINGAACTLGLTELERCKVIDTRLIFGPVIPDTLNGPDGHWCVFPNHDIRFYRTQAVAHCPPYFRREFVEPNGWWVCKDTRPHDERYVIKISPQETSEIILSVEPGKTSDTLVAKVFGQNGQLIPNVDVQLVVDVVENSGGHDRHDTQRPKGELHGGQPVVGSKTTITGATGSDGGGQTFTFKAPAPAGDHTIIASCTDRDCTQEGADRVWVGVKFLVPIPNDPSTYIRIGQTDFHLNNHYLTSSALHKMTRLAVLYKELFPNDPVLHLNDASLERGGLFDLNKKWFATNKEGHQTHRIGNIIDIRANPAVKPETAIPERNFQRIIQLACRLGGIAGIHSPSTANQHFHVQFSGCTAATALNTFEPAPTPSPSPDPTPPPLPDPTPPPGDVPAS